MIETNIRIVDGGLGVRLPIRYARVQGPHLTSKQLEQACGALLFRHGLAAKASGDEGELVVLSAKPIPGLTLEDDDFRLAVSDSGKGDGHLSLRDDAGPRMIPWLLERALTGVLSRSTGLWRLDSPRKWFQPTPFLSEEGIDAYRRFEISALFIQDLGVGIAVDVSTAFVTRQTLAHYFDQSVPPLEQRNREAAFNRLTSRQKGQKGTLIYDLGYTRRVCYFEKPGQDRRCSQIRDLRIQGRAYDSLHHYYAERHPKLNVGADEPAVLVSFRGIEHPVWVAARLLQVRVMNDSLPDSLVSVDKIAPAERVRMIDEFWSLLGHTPFGDVSLGVSPTFWRPESGRVLHVPMPSLEFGKGQVLHPPARVDPEAYKKNYHQRVELLDTAGVYHLPPATERVLHCAHPATLDAAIPKQLAEDIVGFLGKWTGVSFSAAFLQYGSLTEAAARLRTGGPSGAVLLVLGNEPAAYYEAAFQLPGWRLKRVTEASLREHYRYLTDGAWDRRAKHFDQRRGWRKWDQYVRMNAYDVLQQLDGVLYRVPTLGDCEAVLAIDVGHDRRYIATSLLIARQKGKAPNFAIVTEVDPKTDPRLETINPTILADMVVQLFTKVLRGRYDPLASLLVLRDGELRGEESAGLARAFARLRSEGRLTEGAATVVAELHKSSQKGIRLWDRTTERQATNPLEGTAVILGSDSAVVATTGRATLHQGTAEPLMIVCDQPSGGLHTLVAAVVTGAQLNWSSPGVAQRLPLVFKRTDEQLETRAAQEIRRVA